MLENWLVYLNYWGELLTLVILVQLTVHKALPNPQDLTSAIIKNLLISYTFGLWLMAHSRIPKPQILQVVTFHYHRMQITLPLTLRKMIFSPCGCYSKRVAFSLTHFYTTFTCQNRKTPYQVSAQLKILGFKTLRTNLVNISNMGSVGLVVSLSVLMNLPKPETTEGRSSNSLRMCYLLGLWWISTWLWAKFETRSRDNPKHPVHMEVSHQQGHTFCFLFLIKGSFWKYQIMSIQ